MSEVSRDEAARRCLEVAERYLGYRARSEAELREKLRRRGFADATVSGVLARLKEIGLVDDTAFVQTWVEGREMSRPRSRRLVRLELSKKGVNHEIIDQVVGSINDSDSAYRAAVDKARRLPLADREAFRRRLGDFLRRRGFDYEVSARTVDLVWQEMNVSKSEVK